MSGNIDDQVRPDVVDYGQVVDEVAQAEIAKRAGELAEQELISGELVRVASMRDLAPSAEWAGTISKNGEGSLTSEQETKYVELIQQALVYTSGDEAQVGCMDGRGLADAIDLGPKTASGTLGNTYRLMLASKADSESPDLDFEAAFSLMTEIDQKLGYNSGTHAPTQCGAQKFAKYATETVCNQGEVVSKATETFFGALGAEYSAQIEADLIVAAKEITDLPDNEVAEHSLAAKNPQSCPNLPGEHKEKAIVVFLDDEVTLDNNKLIELTSQELGQEAQAFGYNWGYHVKIAEQLGDRLGAYYLHAVASEDIPVLTRLTDGSLDIFAFKR